MALLEFSQKRRLRRIIYSKPVALVFVVLVALLAHGVWNMSVTASEAAARREAAATELQALKEREAFLDAKISELKTPRGLEEEVREKFDVAKAGEKVIVIVEPEDTGGEGDGEESGGIFNWIGGWFE